MASLSVHDNWLYGHAVDHERRRIVLHTVHPHTGSPEYTDVVFEGVVTHHFELQRFGDYETAPANVLFDVDEEDHIFVLTRYERVLRPLRGWNWPLESFDGMDDLAERLRADGVKCFQVEGTVGLTGFVLARSLELRPRAGRAQIAEPG